MNSQETVAYHSTARQLICRGEWNIATIPQLQSLLAAISWPQSGEITIDGNQITKMDSAGAWLIAALQIKLAKQNVKSTLQAFSKEHLALIELIDNKLKAETTLPTVEKPSWLARVGMMTMEQYGEFKLYLAFVGNLTYEFIRLLSNPKHLRWPSFAGIIYRTGYQALPIIALLSFMVGVVIAYQMGLQLRSYGANVYIVDFLGLSVLREFGPLLTAIMVAGRTGSSFTAQLGIMKVNQEIDALDTMGVTPAELLILPRIAGLFIALPLLTMWANIFGVFGGMIMAKNMLDIGFADFLYRFPNVIPLKTLMIGLGKAPIFALIIASIGCFQGMQVKGSADSVGMNTTRSVVLAIFFIIVADAMFSIIFSKLNL